MANPRNTSGAGPHSGGNPKFWEDDAVRTYDYNQSIVSEKKEEVLSIVTRIAAYFCRIHSIAEPKILDVGCGPGTLSTRILDGLPTAVVVGADSSAQMVEAAMHNLVPKYGMRFSGHVSNFNSEGLWIPDVDSTYHLIVSSGALHYLSDERLVPFFREAHSHLVSNGALVASIGALSECAEIAEMESLFRIEFIHRRLEEERGPQDIEKVRRNCEEADKRANISWRSPGEYLDSMRTAGFRKADMVWQLWVKGIFVAIR